MRTAMNEYAVAKWLHILSSTVLFGTGLGSAYYMLFTSLVARRSGGDARAVAVVVRHVVHADWWFTSTTIVFQPLSGLWLVHLAGYPLASTWIVASFGLYLLAGACWLPVVWMQLRMRDLAEAAAATGAPLPALYFRYLTRWTLLGIPAFVALVVVFWLMVAKPA
jgi:uncharacterized membrane protein